MLFEKLPWPCSGIPRRSRIGLCAPSAATTYCARIVSSSPVSRCLTVAVTPSPSWSTDTVSYE